MSTQNQINVVPIVDRNRGFKSWLITERYVPGGAAGRYVPNVNDEIVEWASNHYLIYRVRDVDYTTCESTLQLMHEIPFNNDVSQTDIILSAAPGRSAEAFRAYIDRSVKPATISFDRRMFVLGTMSRSAMVFKGTNIGEGGEVISAMYDQGGTLLGQAIPLEQVATVKIPAAGQAEAIDSAVKIVSTGYLARDVIDNEVLTVVFYGDDGQVVQTQSVVAYNTSFARQPDASRRYVTGIRLKTGFLSPGDDTHVVIPRNLTLESVLAIGEVVYSDGSRKELPVDGARMAIHGLYNDRYLANSDGYRSTLILTYRLEPGEYLYGATVGEYPHMSKKYTVETTAFEKAFAARIWAYPQWMSDVAGYRMRYFLSTLSRDHLYDVTDKVRLGVNSPAFEPLLYGARQNLILTLDMNLVDPIFKTFKFVQPTTVTLYGPGHAADTSYTVNFVPGNPEVFGIDLKVRGDYRSAGQWLVDVSQGAGSRDDWLDKMFVKIHPIFNPATELRSPTPTHFVMVIAGQRIEVPVINWASQLNVNAQPRPGEVVFFEWILRDGNGDHLLGLSAVPFYQVD